MRCLLCSFAILLGAMLLGGAGPNPASGGVQLAPAPVRTFTGILEQRVFIQNCHCFPWVIDKNGLVFEVDVSAVMSDALALQGHRVRAIGTWSTYRRAGRAVAYLKVQRLDPV